MRAVPEKPAMPNLLSAEIAAQITTGVRTSIDQKIRRTRLALQLGMSNYGGGRSNIPEIGASVLEEPDSLLRIQLNCQTEPFVK